MSTKPTSGADVETIFRDSMASLASGVVVVTAAAPDGSLHGLTVTSLASYSANPPSIIVCIDETCNSYITLTEGSHFAVNLLRAEQSGIARKFAASSSDKFTQIRWTLWENAVPVLEDTLGLVICRRSSTTVHGDHAIVIGDVIDGYTRQGQPLVYWHRGFYEGPGRQAVSE
jgi:flavin reductase ActVB